MMQSKIKVALFFDLPLWFQQLKWVEVKGTIQHLERNKNISFNML